MTLARKKRKYSTIFMELDIMTPLLKNILSKIKKTKTNWRSHNNNTWNVTASYQRLRPNKIKFRWMYNHQWKRKWEHKKILLLDFITYTSLNYKELSAKIFEVG